MARKKAAATAQEQVVEEVVVETTTTETPEVAEETVVAEDTPAETTETASEVSDEDEDDVEEVANEEVSEEEEKKPSNLKFFKFHRDQAKEFGLDENNFMNVIVFKKFDFSFNAKDGVDLEGEKAKIVKSINRILSIMKAQDTICNVHDSELRYNGINTVYTIFVPYSEKLNIISQNIYRMINSLTSENQSISYRVKTKNIARIHLEKEAKTIGFFKGFVAVAHENARKDAATGKEFSPAKDYIKCASFIDANVGLTGQELSTFNHFNLSLNKMSLFNDSEKKFENDYNFFLSFKKKFRIVGYELFYNSDNELCAKTSVVTVSLKSENVIQTSNQKIVRGILFSKNENIKSIKNFSDVFIGDNGENIVIDNMYLDPNSYEMATFDTEVDIIDKNIICSLSVKS